MYYMILLAKLDNKTVGYYNIDFETNTFEVVTDLEKATKFDVETYDNEVQYYLQKIRQSEQKLAYSCIAVRISKEIILNHKELCNNKVPIEELLEILD